jgi:hypothetical protein
MHRHEVNCIRADRFRGHDEVTGVALFVIDQNDLATCSHLVYCILNGVKLHGLNCPPLSRSITDAPSRLLVADRIIAGPLRDVDNTTAPELSREIRHAGQPQGTLPVDSHWGTAIMGDVVLDASFAVEH